MQPPIATNSHLGFWVPVGRGQGQQPVPGATAAYLDQRAAAVFKYDPPSMAAFGDAVSARWAEYMTSHFAQTLFVSLPVTLPKPDRQRVRAAVLNVNVSGTKGDRTWNRLYHGPWLEAALEAVSLPAATAYWAYRLRTADNRPIDFLRPKDDRPFGLLPTSN